MSEIKIGASETNSEKYLIDLTTRIGDVSIKPKIDGDSDVSKCWLFTSFTNRFIVDERKTLIGELTIKFERDLNNIDLFINHNGELIITGEESEVNRYSIDSNGDLIWVK